MASFHAKIGWKRPRKRKNTNYRSVPFRSYTTRNTKLQKNRIKIQKIKQYLYGFISRQNRLEKAEKEKKYKLSFHSFPTRRVIENSKKIAKKFKKLNNTIMASFQAKIGWKRREREKIKIVIPFRSVPTLRVIENSKKIAKNFKNAIMSSFQAKIYWKMPRKREYKIYRSVSFHTSRN